MFVTVSTQRQIQTCTDEHGASHQVILPNRFKMYHVWMPKQTSKLSSAGH